MPYIEWMPSLSVGVREIDAQHKNLVAYINELAAAREEGRAREAVSPLLAKLQAYVLEHFALEERYFDSFGFPGAIAHKKEHADFAAKVEAFGRDFAAGKAELSDEMLLFLRSWLTSHISFSDRKYRSLFIEKGLR